MGKYIALHAIQVGPKEARVKIHPASRDGKVSGLFEHDFDPRTEKRLLDTGAIRRPEGTEEHAEPTPRTELENSNLPPAAASAATPQTPDDGLDDKTVADLKALAEAEQIDLGDATLKADIIAAIRAARA